jgi:hypothetical protein
MHFGAMADLRNKNSDCHVLYLADHAIVADLVSPQSAKWTGQSFAEAARVVVLGCAVI